MNFYNSSHTTPPADLRSNSAALQRYCKNNHRQKESWNMHTVIIIVIASVLITPVIRAAMLSIRARLKNCWVLKSPLNPIRLKSGLFLSILYLIVSAEGVIKISDVSGKLITAIPINGKQGQKIWDTREIKSGVYFYTLHVSGFKKSGKIVVSK
jgi:hypothetical protein